MFITATIIITGMAMTSTMGIMTTTLRYMMASPMTRANSACMCTTMRVAQA